MSDPHNAAGWQLGRVSLYDVDLLTDFTSPSKGQHLARHGRETQATAEICLALPIGNPARPGAEYQRREQAIYDRLRAVKERFLAGDPLADRRAARAKLAETQARRTQAEEDAAKHRRLAIAALAAGADPSGHQQAALLADEAAKSLSQYARQLADEISEAPRFAAGMLKHLLTEELAAIRAECQAAAEEARRRLRQAVAPLLEAAWMEGMLAELTREKTAMELQTAHCPTESFMDRLAEVSGHTDRPPRQPSPYSQTPYDGLPGGHGPSLADYREALGSREPSPVAPAVGADSAPGGISYH